MRIAISGTHGIGKTTLAKWLSEELGIQMLGEKARGLLESTYPFEIIDRDTTSFLDFQREVLDLQEAEAWTKRNESYVVDRTPVDSLAYVVERLGAERYPFSYFYEKYREKVLESFQSAKYDYIFFLDFSVYDTGFWKGKVDGNRNLSPMYMKTISDIMLSIYEDLKDKGGYFGERGPIFCKIKTSDKEIRRQLVKEQLGEQIC